MAEEPGFIEVSIVEAGSATALIEWLDETGMPHRGFLPLRAITENGSVAEKNLAKAVPYGIPWEELITVQTDPKQIAQALRLAGIWTLDDLTANFAKALGAFQKGIRLDVAALIEAAAEYISGGK